jgi:tetratricopeptide (TPR) repeat protein
VSAVAHLEKAVTLDPNYLDAWIWLIDSYTRQGVGGIAHRPVIKAAQQRAIQKVSELAPQSLYAEIAESYGALANGDLLSAGRLLQSTLSAPAGIRARVSMRYGQFLLSVGRGTASVEQLTQARAVDPLDVFLRMQVLLALDVSGQRVRADAEARELRQLPGGDTVLLRRDQLTRAMDRGDRNALRAALAETDDSLLGHNGLKESLLAALDNPPAARDALQHTLEDPRTASDVFAMTTTMEWAAFLGDPELALRAAHQAADLGVSFETWGWTIWRPVMREVRRQSGFKTLLRQMGLVDYWRATGHWGDFCEPVGSDDFQCT